MLLPQARTTDIIEQVAGEELMIYDLRTDRAYALNDTSRAVFKACVAKTSFEDLKRTSEYSGDLIYLALDELKANNLLAGEYQLQFTRMSRREAVRRVGLASLIALPVVSVLVAPSSVAAASTACSCAAAINTNARLEGCPCVSNGDCCGVCFFNGGNPVCSAPTPAAQPTAAACCPAVIV